MTVGDLVERLTRDEYEQWFHYFEIKAEAERERRG